MRWEERLLDLFDDLEQQAEGIALAERDLLVAEQSRGEYASVELADRLHASLGARVQVEVAGVGSLEATLVRAGDGWCLLEASGQDWIVVLRAVCAVRGLRSGGVAADARPATARLGLGSALRGVSEARTEVALHRTDGATTRGLLGRVGADFVELWASPEAGGLVEVVPFRAVVAVRGG